MGLHDFREIGILGQKADARMHRISACYPRRSQNRGDVEIGVGAARRADTDRFIGEAHRH